MALWREIDQLLRGRFTAADDLREGRVGLPARRLAIASLLCGALYGVCMGVYGAARGTEAGTWQLAVNALKVPLLFLLTLVVTFPSLYVFSALAGSRLSLSDTLRLLVAAVTVNLAVLASFGPITVFFTVFTKSYAFIKLLNVVLFALAGLVSLGFLSRAVRHVFSSKAAADEGRLPVTAPVAAAATAIAAHAGAGGSGSSASAGQSASGGHSGSAGHSGSFGPARRVGEGEGERRARMIFRVWLVIYGVVGAQMGWILRPFVGHPDMPFVIFRHQGESNFFQAMVDVFRDLARG